MDEASIAVEKHFGYINGKHVMQVALVKNKLPTFDASLKYLKEAITKDLEYFVSAIPEYSHMSTEVEVFTLSLNEDSPEMVYVSFDPLWDIAYITTTLYRLF
jgi:hypothetical protein